MKFLQFIRRLIEAVQHVRSGGATTVRTARRRSTAPPRRCTECQQPVQHSTDYRDHLH